jgi:hypothetical protein
MIEAENNGSIPELTEYKGDPAMIKVTLGIGKGASQLWNPEKQEMEFSKYDMPRPDGNW